MNPRDERHSRSGEQKPLESALKSTPRVEKPSVTGSVAPLIHPPGRVTDSGKAADAYVEIWEAISATLTPIIGHRGLAMLYQRALGLTLEAVPWLSPARETDEFLIDLVALRSVFFHQPVSTAVFGGNELLKTFYGLLESLIGVALTGRLLADVPHRAVVTASGQESGA